MHTHFYSLLCVGGSQTVSVSRPTCMCVCVCLRPQFFVRVCVCDAVAQSDRYSVEEERLAHAEMRQLSLPPRPCPFNPGWQWAASHMARASCIWRRAGGGKTGITTTCVCVYNVCVSHKRCTFMVHITSQLLDGIMCVYLHMSLWTDALLLSSPLLFTVNPSVRLSDCGPHRGHLLSDSSGKRTTCHVSSPSV